MDVSYTPNFVRKIKKLPKSLQEEVIEKIELFKIKPSNPTFKIHPLHGKFAGAYSFSVDYSHRIVFEYLSKTKIVLLDFGDHDIYK